MDQLIISLIRDDLTNTQLINALNSLGLDASNYHLHLTEVIFQLVGFPKSDLNDELYDRYFRLMESKTFFPDRDLLSFEMKAIAIYEEVKGWR